MKLISRAESQLTEPVTGMKSLFEYLNATQQQELERITRLLCWRFNPGMISCTRARLSSTVSLDCWNKDKVKLNCDYEILLVGDRDMLNEQAAIRDFVRVNFQGGNIELYFEDAETMYANERRTVNGSLYQKGFLLFEGERVNAAEKAVGSPVDT